METKNIFLFCFLLIASACNVKSQGDIYRLQFRRQESWYGLMSLVTMACLIVQNGDMKMVLSATENHNTIQ